MILGPDSAPEAGRKTAFGRRLRGKEAKRVPSALGGMREQGGTRNTTSAGGAFPVVRQATVRAKMPAPLCCHVRVSGQVLRYAAKAAVDEKPVAGGVLVEVPRLPKTVLGEHR